MNQGRYNTDNEFHVKVNMVFEKVKRALQEQEEAIAIAKKFVKHAKSKVADYEQQKDGLFNMFRRNGHITGAGQAERSYEIELDKGILLDDKHIQSKVDRITKPSSASQQRGKSKGGHTQTTPYNKQ